MLTSLADVDRIALGEEQHRRTEAHRGGAGGQIGQRDERLEEPAARGSGDAAVVRVGVGALVLPEQHDVLAYPDGPDVACLGALGDRIEQLGRRHRARSRHPEIELHVS